MYVEFIPGEKRPTKDKLISESIDTFTDCGYVIEEDDVIIDIDEVDKEILKHMIDILDIKTKYIWTNRGIHLYYRKPDGFRRRKEQYCALGFKIETKTKADHYITVKQNGVARTVVNEDLKEELPWYFRKAFKNRLLGVSEGEGRNSLLYAQKMALGNQDKWYEILTFINDYIFDEPLSEKEFMSVARSEKIDSKVNTQNEIADTLIRELNVTDWLGSLWWKYRDQYVTDSKDIRLKKYIYRKCPDVNSRYIEEILKQIEIKCMHLDDYHVFPIKFKNGVLYKSGEFRYEDYDDFTPYYIDIDYFENAEPVKIVDDYIENLTNNNGQGDKEYRDLLLEILGYSLITDPKRVSALGKFFIFRGDGMNGKGTLLNIIRRILGNENCSSLSIEQLGNDRDNSQIIGKLANLGDDIEGNAINNKQLKMLKNISTADSFTIRPLYKESRTIKPNCKMYFTTNTTIKSYEKGYGYQRRVMWLPMFNTIEKVDPFFIEKITSKEALEYWIRLIMEGYKRLMDNKRFTESKCVTEFNDEYHEENNYMRTFVKSLDPDIDLYGKTISEIKMIFEDYTDDDTMCFKKKQFIDAVWSVYKMNFHSKRLGKDKSARRRLVYQSEVSKSIAPT